MSGWVNLFLFRQTPLWVSLELQQTKVPVSSTWPRLITNYHFCPLTILISDPVLLLTFSISKVHFIQPISYNTDSCFQPFIFQLLHISYFKENTLSFQSWDIEFFYSLVVFLFLLDSYFVYTCFRIWTELTVDKINIFITLLDFLLKEVLEFFYCLNIGSIIRFPKSNVLLIFTKT